AVVPGGVLFLESPDKGGPSMRMRTMSWIMAVLVGLVVLAPLPCHAQGQPAAQASPTAVHESSSDAAVVLEYAQREAASRGLEDFEGGSAGLILALALIAAVVIIVA